MFIGWTIAILSIFATIAGASEPDIGAFPYEYRAVPGREAVAARLAWANETGGQVVIVGDREDFEALSYPFRDLEETIGFLGTVDEILAQANAIRHPEGLHAHRREETEQMREFLESRGYEFIPFDPEGIPLGAWPSSLQGLLLDGPTVHTHYTGRIHEEVYLVNIPAKASWEIPAYLYWGGWNANPPPHIHIAALRDWHAKYGATLVGITDDVLNLSVETPPTSREEALALAKDQYIYCEDIVLQGVGDIAPLAASLMESSHWYFWWD